MDYGKEQKFDLDQYNLDTDEWNSSAESQHDSSALGSRAISASENISQPESELHTTELGHITSTTPLDYPKPTTQETSQTNTPNPKIYAHPENPAVVDDIENNQIRKLSNDQDAAAFVDFYDAASALAQGQEAA